MKAIAGIDIGSSAIKAALLSVDGGHAIDLLETRSQPLHPKIANVPVGHFEENPNIIREQVFEALRTLGQSARMHQVSLQAIAFTGQMHGGLLVDHKLEPLTNFITWQDKRGDEITERGKSYVEELRLLASHDATGVSVHSGFLISTLYWFERNGRIPNSTEKVLGIYDWLTSVLVGGAVTDRSSAAAWAMFDPITSRWRNDLLNTIHIPTRWLPDIVEPGALLGTIRKDIAESLQLNPSIEIHASIGDTQAAYLGSECRPNELLLNFGTGSQSLWQTDLLEATTGTDIRCLRNGTYLACAPTLAGGEAYLIAANFFQDVVKQFVDRDISIAETLSIMDRLATDSISNGLTVDPIFRGSKFRNDGDRGSIEYIDSENFRASSIVRALVEGMIEEIAQPFFVRNEKRTIAGLVGEGSALRKNAALRSIAETRFGLPMRLGRFPEAAAAGAALLCIDSYIDS